MSDKALFVVSAWQSPNDELLVGCGGVRAVRQAALSETDIDDARAIITTMHLDQIGFLAFREALARFFARGGRLVYNGHLLRPFVSGLPVFVPLAEQSADNLALTPLREHAIFAGFDVPALMHRRGVAGFYGRGHVPLPPGAEAVTGIGGAKLPVDWEWSLPNGGQMFLHAGNDLWGIPEDEEAETRLGKNIIEWAAHGRNGES